MDDDKQLTFTNFEVKPAYIGIDGPDTAQTAGFSRMYLDVPIEVDITSRQLLSRDAAGWHWADQESIVPLITQDQVLARTEPGPGPASGLDMTGPNSLRSMLGLGSAEGPLPIPNGGNGSTTTTLAVPTVPVGTRLVDWLRTGDSLGNAHRFGWFILPQNHAENNTGNALGCMVVSNNLPIANAGGSIIATAVDRNANQRVWVASTPVTGNLFVFQPVITQSMLNSALTGLTHEDVGAAPADHTHPIVGGTTGTLTVARGGTGQTTALAAMAALGGPAFAESTTTAGQQDKAATITNFVRRTGAVVVVHFTANNTHGTPRLNVTSTGAANIVDTARVSVGARLVAGTYILAFDGTRWVALNIPGNAQLQASLNNLPLV